MLAVMYRVAQKLAHFVLYALTSSNVDRFSNFFKCENRENIWNNTIIKDPITPRVSLHYLVKCQCLKSND